MTETLSRKIPFQHVFPPDHWLAGLEVERGRMCGCGERFFLQLLVTADYLAALRAPLSKLYQDSVCETEQKGTVVRVWTPNACKDCLKKANEKNDFNREPPK